VVAGTSRRIRERGHEEVWLRRAFYRGRRCARKGIERFGPIGAVDLADRIGRDYTTVSRQVAKLDELGLVRRQAGVGDGRVREAVVTPQGEAMTDAVDAAREQLGRAIFADWEPRDVAELVRLMSEFAEAINTAPE
jgi:DNA-binding MarR family transcriptional regulator